MLSFIGSFILKFLSSKTVTGILLLIIGIGLIYIKTLTFRLNKCKINSLKQEKQYEEKISNLKSILQNRNYEIANYKKQINDLENIIKDIKLELEKKNKNNQELKRKLDDLQVIRKALEGKINNLMKIKLPKGKKEKNNFATKKIIELFYDGDIKNEENIQ